MKLNDYMKSGEGPDMIEGAAKGSKGGVGLWPLSYQWTDVRVDGDKFKAQLMRDRIIYANVYSVFLALIGDLKLNDTAGIGAGRILRDF